MLVTVVIPRSQNRYISQTVRNKYTELWKQWCIENYPNRSYTRAKLNANIRKALSVNGKSFSERDFRHSAINRWSGRKVLPFAHWYFLVRFQADLFGKVYAVVEDACYEGDYHNDKMNTKPYGESIMRGLFMNIIKENKDNAMRTNKKVVRITESDLHTIITEAVKIALNELDPRTYANAAAKRRAQGNNKSAKALEKFSVKAFNDQYGVDDENVDGFDMPHGKIYHYSKDRLSMDDKNNLHRDMAYGNSINNPDGEASWSDEVLSNPSRDLRGQDIPLYNRYEGDYSPSGRGSKETFNNITRRSNGSVEHTSNTYKRTPYRIGDKERSIADHLYGLKKGKVGTDKWERIYARSKNF